MLRRSIDRARRTGALVTWMLTLFATPALADAPAPAGTCPAGTIEPMARRVSPSVVEVEGPGGIARGFVFGSDRLVVTLLHVVEAGRGILVRGASGDVRHARVALTDPDHDLAFVELATPLPDAHPLETSTEPLERGTTVLAFASVPDATSADAVTAGAITRVAGDHFNASARVGFHASWGSPLVDCAGRVVGVATVERDDAVRAGVLRALADRAADAPEYSSGWSLAHPSFGTLFSIGSGEPWLGVYLGTSLVGDDRFELSLRGGASARIDAPRTDRPSYDTQFGLRLWGDARIGDRILLNEGFLPVYLVPTVGAVGGWEKRWRTEARQQVTGSGCSPSAPCPVESVTATKQEGSRFWLAPVAGAAVRFGPVEIGYSLELDVRRPAASTHTFTLGVQF